MIRLSFVGLALLLAGPVLAGSPDPKSLEIPAEELSRARELVQQLGSEQYAEREEAEQELAKMGRLARPALLEAANTDANQEIRSRASGLLPRATSLDFKARLDVFLAAKKVGPSGKAIGIDMTPEMVELARKNAEKAGADGTPLANVEFHLAAIDRMPLAAASVDCVISNCVINLASDKRAVFREIARVLKPGGRLAVSDIALKKNLPAAIEKDIMAYVGCIAGAILIEDYKAALLGAGFAHVEVIDSGADGLVMLPDASQPFDIVWRDAKDQANYDGNWKAQKVSEADYRQRFEKDEKEYAELLAALIAGASQATTP